MRRPQSLDRRLGRMVRALIARVPGGTRAGSVAGDALSPAFQGVVAVMLARPALRGGGARALAAGVLASLVARLARDRIARPRPGGRTDGGFPSRHAAAAVAIARSAGRRHPRLRLWLVAAAVAGLAGRVVAEHHDPADIAGGAALGWACDRLVERIAG